MRKPSLPLEAAAWATAGPASSLPCISTLSLCWKGGDALGYFQHLRVSRGYHSFNCLKMGGVYDKFWLIKSRILINIWEPVCCQCTSNNKERTGKHQRQSRQQEVCVRGETITMGNFSPRQLLVLLPYQLRAFFTGAALCCPASLSSCPKPFHCPLKKVPPFLLFFTPCFSVRFSLFAQTAERKDGPKVRVTAWAEESHIQFSLPLTSHPTLDILFHTSSFHHCLLQSIAQRHLLNVPNTLNLMLGTSHVKRSCQFWLDIYP